MLSPFYENPDREPNARPGAEYYWNIHFRPERVITDEYIQREYERLVRRFSAADEVGDDALARGRQSRRRGSRA